MRGIQENKNSEKGEQRQEGNNEDDIEASAFIKHPIMTALYSLELISFGPKEKTLIVEIPY